MVTPYTKRFYLEDHNSNNHSTCFPVSAVDAIAAPSHGRRVSVSPEKVLPVTTARSSAVVVLNLPKYEERTGVEWSGVGKVVVSSRPKATTAKTKATTTALPLDRNVTPGTKIPRCIIDTEPFGDTNVTQPYRSMFTTLEEKSNRLDDWLVTQGETLLERLPEGLAQVLKP